MATVITIASASVEMTYTDQTPETALVAAFEQSQGNFNWWNYAPVEHYPLRMKDGVLTLGEFTVANVQDQGNTLGEVP